MKAQEMAYLAGEAFYVAANWLMALPTLRQLGVVAEKRNKKNTKRIMRGG